MKIRYLAENIHCQKCANTILNSLSDEFSDVEIAVEQKEISVKLESKEQEEAFKKEMSEMGFPITQELERS